MTAPLRIAIAGLGTVGGGTVELLQKSREMIAERAGRALEIVAVSARNKVKARSFDFAGVRFVDDALMLASMDEVDVVVEVIGGSEGVAKQLVEAALKNGKHVVTANKALIAHYGIQLAELAEQHDCVLAFEAAVAGGIPIIKALRDGLAANQFTRVAGILNGTCNYILTQMERHQAAFEPVLAEAQALGYAEAEPSFDVDGIDTAHKIAILASLAFGCAPSIDKVRTDGIRRIAPADIKAAHELGYRIKLLGIASLGEHGLEQHVQPCLVPLSSPLANVHEVYNAITLEGDAVGKVFFEGRGAGAGPTASSIVADLMDIARGVNYKPLTLPVPRLRALAHASEDYIISSYYLRLRVHDQPGVLADVTSLLSEQGISVRSFLQRPGDAEAVDVIVTTHATSMRAMHESMHKISQLKALRAEPNLIRVEE